MIIGAQGFTIRDFTKDEAGIAVSLKRLHDIGYRALQVSAFGPIAPERLRALADENEMKIVVTHTNPERIRSDTAGGYQRTSDFGLSVCWNRYDAGKIYWKSGWIKRFSCGFR